MSASDTLIIQSHRTPLPYTWINDCITSVRSWCNLNSFDYRFLGDELFNIIPTGLLEKIKPQVVIASDLARILTIQQALKRGIETVVWLDADFLIFDPINFNLPDEDFAIGREVWVQKDKSRKLRVYKKVHNAFLMFRRENSFLDFYIATAMRLLKQNTGSMPLQFIGPKLLTAIHNVAVLPVMETAAMLSPMVCKDMLDGEGAALDLFRRNTKVFPTAANLCISSCDRNEISDIEVQQLIELLLSRKVH